MNSDETKWMRNAIGPVIFSFGALAVVLVLMAWLKGMPAEQATGFDGLARDLVGFLGGLPLAVLGLAAAFLGGRLFVVGPDPRLVRNLGSAALLCVALAVFLATILPQSGGALGELVGGSVRDKAPHPVLAFVFGVLVLAAPVYFLFVRERFLEYLAVAGGPTPESQEEVEAAGGISREEADALLPEDEPVSPIGTKSGSTELAQLLATRTEERPEWLEKSGSRQAPSPYAEDVRLKGGIPEGAAPLVPETPTPDESTTESPSVHRWAPASLRLAEDALGADLAEDEPAADDAAVEAELDEPAGDEPTGPAELIAAASVEVEEEDAVEPEAEFDEEFEDELEEPAPPATPAGTKPLVAARPSRPTPSWEQSNLFDEEDEEQAVAALDEEHEEEAEFEEPESAAARAEYDDDEESEYEDEDEADDEDDEEWEYEDEDGAEGDEDEEEYEDEDEDDEEDDEEDEEDDDEEYEDDDEEEDEEDGEVEWEDEDDLYDEAEESEEELEHDVAAESEEELEPAAELEAEVEDELEPAAELEEDLEPAAELDEDLEPVAEDSDEPELVLTPMAPPARETVTAEEAESLARVTSDVIYEAGELFLERGRVAVSMLQREFNLDFDESCEVMDRLQDMGLIGPYVGGHRRDILMSKDQWLERVTLP